MIPPEHCTDERLLEYLDHELPEPEALAIEIHIGACWHCRSRLNRLDESARKVADVFHEEMFPGPRRMAVAGRKIFSRIADYEREGATAPGFAQMAGRVRWAPWASLAAGCILAALGWFRTQAPAGPALADVLAAAQESEQRFLEERPGVRQRFQIEMEEEVPVRRRRSATLEVWSEAASGRFAARWMEPDARLKFGLWRPAPATAYIYNSTKSAEVKTLPASRVAGLGLADAFDAGAGDLEAAFFDWLSRRDWRAVSWSDNFARMIGTDGFSASLERRGPAEDQVIVLTATNRGEGMTLTVELEVSAGSLHPTRFALRYRNMDRTFAVRVRVLDTHRVEAARLLRATFEPDPALQARRGMPAPKAMLDVPPAPAAPTLAETFAAEIRTRLALHRAKACLGEPLEITMTAGRIRVQGFVQTQERREELLAALGALKGAAYAAPDLRTVSELLAGRHKADGDTRSVVSASAGSGALLAEESLRRFLRSRAGHIPDADVEQAIVQFTHRAISHAEVIFMEGAALRQLAQRYGSGAWGMEDAESSILLTNMIEDHVHSLRLELDRAEELLVPVLERMAGAGRRLPDPRPGAGAAAAWPLIAMRVSREAAAVSEWMHELFAAGAKGSAGEGEAAAGLAAARLSDALQAVRDEIQAWPRE